MHQKDDQEFAKLLNRLHIGKQTIDDLRILQSKKVTQEQFETLHLIPHFFPTRRKVESYKESVLKSSSQYTLTITTINIPPSDISASAKENLQPAINKRTANVVSNISKDKTATQTFLLLFGYSLKMIVLDQDSAGIIVIYTREGNISPGWMPISAQKRTFLVESVWVAHVQFLDHHAAAQTIHMAQSATFKSIYIDMQTNTNPPKIWWQHMHYVALS